MRKHIAELEKRSTGYWWSDGVTKLALVRLSLGQRIKLLFSKRIYVGTKGRMVWFTLDKPLEVKK